MNNSYVVADEINSLVNRSTTYMTDWQQYSVSVVISSLYLSHYLIEIGFVPQGYPFAVRLELNQGDHGLRESAAERQVQAFQSGAE